MFNAIKHFHLSLSLSLSLAISLFLCVCVLVCSVRLWLGPEWLLHEERGLPLPTGLPEASRHALQQLQGVRGGRGGHGPGEDLPPSLLCVHRLQVSLTRPEEERLLFLVRKDCVPSLCLSLSLSVCSSDVPFLRGSVSPSVEKTASVSAAFDPSLLLPTTSAIRIVRAEITLWAKGQLIPCSYQY